jgi:hypothetical protein
MTTTTALPPAARTNASTATPTLGQNLRSLAIDIVVPTATYYLLTKAFDVGLVWALTASSVLPLIRTVSSQVRERHINALAALMLTINAVGIASSFLVGDPRLMIAKDSLISSVVGFGIIVSVFRGRPMMTAALEPWLTKGDPDRTVAWGRLAGESSQFRRLEVRYNLIWAVALLAECAARIVGAFTLPIATMVWLSGVMIGVSITLAIVVGSTATVPMERLLKSCGPEHPAECTRREQGAGR